MRDYEEFVSGLRREIEQAGLGRPDPVFRGLRKGARAATGRPRWVAAAALLLAAVGVGGYAGYHAYENRRLVTEHNRQFVDSLFARGLFEVEAVPVMRLEALATRSLFESTAAAGRSSGADWLTDGRTEPSQAE